MKKFPFIILALAFIIGGCANYRDIRIDDVDVAGIKVVALNAAQVALELQVNNPTKAVFEIADVKGTLKKEGSPFAAITTVKGKECIIAPGNPSNAQLTLRIEVLDPLSAIVTGFKPGAWDMKEFTVDAIITIKKGAVAKIVKLKDLPAEQLVKEI